MTETREELIRQMTQLIKALKMVEELVLLYVDGVENEITPAKNSIHKILARSARKYGVLSSDIRGRTRSSRVNSARNEFCHLASIEGYSTNEIGKFLDRRDHSTIIHSIRRHKEAIANVR